MGWIKNIRVLCNLYSLLKHSFIEKKSVTHYLCFSIKIIFLSNEMEQNLVEHTNDFPSNWYSLCETKFRNIRYNKYYLHLNPNALTSRWTLFIILRRTSIFSQKIYPILREDKYDVVEKFNCVLQRKYFRRECRIIFIVSLNCLRV